MCGLLKISALLKFTENFAPLVYTLFLYAFQHVMSGLQIPLPLACAVDHAAALQ